MTTRVKAGIVGGSGYIGLELLRVLLAHPACEIKFVTSREHAGKSAGVVHPALQGVTTLGFTQFDPACHDIDVLFVSAPHSESMPIVKAALEANAGLRVVDLSADFRLPPELFAAHYGVAHIAPELAAKAVCGAPELWPDLIQSARLVANPGCFAHCITLALAPLAQSGSISGPVKVSAVTGSSGSGITAGSKTHHPERNESMSAYNVLKHRHVPEIEQNLARLHERGLAPQIKLVPVSGPFTRGIFATCFVTISSSTLDVPALYQQFVATRPFLRLRSETPRLSDVRGSNFVDMAVYQDGTEVVVIAAIDNLMKGGSGNAVQCMNLMFELAPQSGLGSPPFSP